MIYTRKRRTDRSKRSPINREKQWRNRLIIRYEDKGDYLFLILKGTTGVIWNRKTILKLYEVEDWQKEIIKTLYEKNEQVSLRVFIKENDNEGRYSGNFCGF